MVVAQATDALRVRWGSRRRLTDAEALQAVVEWRLALGVMQEVRLVRVDRNQVTDHQGRRGCSLVGVVYDAHSATIYHTRALMAEDLVHELLHVRHSEWTEQQVVAQTERLLQHPYPRSSSHHARRRPPLESSCACGAAHAP